MLGRYKLKQSGLPIYTGAYAHSKATLVTAARSGANTFVRAVHLEVPRTFSSWGLESILAETDRHLGLLETQGICHVNPRWVLLPSLTSTRQQDYDSNLLPRGYILGALVDNVGENSQLTEVGTRDEQLIIYAGVNGYRKILAQEGSTYFMRDIRRPQQYSQLTDNPVGSVCLHDIEPIFSMQNCYGETIANAK